MAERQTKPPNANSDGRTRLEWLWNFFLHCFIRQFCLRSWPMALLLAAPLAMVLGAGEGFGLPKLFWGERGWQEALTCGVALVLTFVVIVYYGFVLDWTDLRSPLRNEMAPQAGWSRLEALWKYVVSMAASMAALGVAGAAIREVVRFLSDHAQTLPYVLGPMAVVVAVAAWWLWQRSRTRKQQEDFAQRLRKQQADAVAVQWRWRYVLLPVVFVTVLWVVRWIGASVSRGEVSVAPAAQLMQVARPELVTMLAWAAATIVVGLISLIKWPPARTEVRALWWAFGVITGCSTMLVVYAALRRPLNPAATICLFAIGAAGVLMIGRAFAGLSWMVILALAIALRALGGAVGGQGSEPGGLPSLAEFYKHNTRASIYAASTSTDPDCPRLVLDPEKPAQPHPVIVVCASGGGISAAAWTVSVLTGLEQLNENFPYSVRIITGASGGMLGAAYYAGTLDPPPPNMGPPEEVRQGLDRLRSLAPGTTRHLSHKIGGFPMTRQQMVDQIAADSLTDVTYTLMMNDLPDGVSPFPGMYDRGRALEQAWVHNTQGALNRTLGDLFDGEQVGWRPSLIFSPMMVENGWRLLISNLDLNALCQNKYPDLASLEHVASRDGVELLGVYPCAGRKLSLATAARLSAGFPFVSPAPQLPFIESRHAVDAGYFDNHGTDLACRWLRANRAWLDANASSILLLHIRTYPREEAADTASGLSRSFSELSAPLTGLMSGRAAMMEYRNDRQIEQLADEHYAEGLPPLKSVTIQCPLSDLPLTWLLSRKQIRDITECPEKDSGVRSQLQSVADWMAGGEAQRWHEDRVIKAFTEGEEIRTDDRTAAARREHILRFAIAEGEISSWMLYKAGQGYDGLEVALMKELTRRIGEKCLIDKDDTVRAEIVGPVSWRKLMVMPKRGEADMVASSISFMPEREHANELRFSIPYHRTWQAWMWRGDSSEPAPNLEDMSGWIAVQENTTSARLLSLMLEPYKESGRLQVRPKKTLAEVLDELGSGRARYAIADEPYGALLNTLVQTGAGPGAKPLRWAPVDHQLTDKLFRSVQERKDYYSIGVADDCPQFLWLVNTVLGEMTEDGTLDRLKKAYEQNAEKWMREGRVREVGEVLGPR